MSEAQTPWITASGRAVPRLGRAAIAVGAALLLAAGACPLAAIAAPPAPAPHLSRPYVPYFQAAAAANWLLFMHDDSDEPAEADEPEEIDEPDELDEPDFGGDDEFDDEYDEDEDDSSGPDGDDEEREYEASESDGEDGSGDEFDRERRRGRGRDSDLDFDEDFDKFVDDEGFEAAGGEVLLMVSREDYDAGELRGLNAEEIHDLTALGLVMVRVTVEEGDDLAERLLDLEDAYGADAADLNHTYFAEAPAAAAAAGTGPAALASTLGLNGKGVGLKLGMIDSAIDVKHPALASAALTTHDFVPTADAGVLNHGTMIAGLLVGSSPGQYEGISTSAELYAANIFHADGDGQALASAEGLIRAIDWLVGARVPIINMSLSGPPNRLVQRAIQMALRRGTITVAAVGNAGPAAPPLFPAAYDEVVAVTAVDRDNHIYRRAVRGNHVDYAAPGVDLPVARAGGGYGVDSGTSLAVPFVVAALAATYKARGGGWDSVLDVLKAESLDLGKKGFDPIYGNGVIRLTAK